VVDDLPAPAVVVGDGGAVVVGDGGAVVVEDDGAVVVEPAACSTTRGPTPPRVGTRWELPAVGITGAC
jgi:hypothetical protein